MIASPDSIGAPVATDGAIHLGWPVTATGLMLGLAIVLITIRLLRGPSLADRVIALDLLGTVTAAAIGLYAVARDEPVYLYVAMAIALLLFVGTVAFAYYIERGPRPAPAASPEDAEAGS